MSEIRAWHELGTVALKGEGAMWGKRYLSCCLAWLLLSIDREHDRKLCLTQVSVDMDSSHGPAENADWGLWLQPGRPQASQSGGPRLLSTEPWANTWLLSVCPIVVGTDGLGAAPVLVAHQKA